MNIALFSPSWPAGTDSNGITTYCAHMKSCLEKDGHKVFVLCCNLLDERADDVYRISFKPSVWEACFIKLLDRFFPGYERYIHVSKGIIRAIDQLEKLHKIDILEMEESFGCHYLVSKKVGFPVVMRLHGPHFLDCKASGKLLERLDFKRYEREKKAFLNACYVNAPSKWVINEVRKMYKPDWKLVEVFGNPIEPNSSDCCWELSACTSFQILFVGRFDWLKGGDVIIKAFAKVLESQPNASLVFAGLDRGLVQSNGSKIHFDDMVDLHIPEKYKGQVQFLGKVDRSALENLRLSCHVSITASRSEVFGYTVVESMSVGVPVIAPEVAGVAELFVNNEGGIFFDVGDYKDAASKLLYLMDNKPLAVSLARKGYQHCCDEFSLANVSKKAVTFYQNVIEDYKTK